MITRFWHFVADDVRKFAKPIVATTLAAAVVVSFLYYETTKYAITVTSMIRGADPNQSSAAVMTFAAEEVIPLVSGRIGYQVFGMLGGTVFGVVLVSILSARIFTAEFQWRTRPLAIIGRGRSMQMGSQLVLATLCTVLILLLSFLTGSIASALGIGAVVESLPGAPTLASELSLTVQFGQLGLAVLSLLTAVVTAGLLGPLIRNTSLTIFACLFWYFAQLLAYTSTGLEWFSIAPSISNSAVLGSLQQEIGGPGLLALPVDTGGLPPGIHVASSVLFIALGVAWMLHRAKSEDVWR